MVNTSEVWNRGLTQHIHTPSIREEAYHIMEDWTYCMACENNIRKTSTY